RDFHVTGVQTCALPIYHISNVQKVFPDKKRPDERYYVLDFTFAELQQLDLTERRTATGELRYPTRFPAGRGKLKIMSLAQQIERSEERRVGKSEDLGGQ